MTSEAGPPEALRQLAAQASRSAGLAADASALSLFSKFAAVEACRANPYQPSLVWHPTAFGCMMQLDLRERVSQDIFMFGAFEPDLLWFLACVLESGASVVDCGAHIGFFTIAAAQLVGPLGRVDAFEPIASTKLHLDTNVRNARLSNAHTHLLGLWSEPSVVEIFDYGPAYSAFNSIGAPRLHPGQCAPEGTPTCVPATSLDAFVTSEGIAPALVKIDVENSEDQVLQGMEKILQTTRPVVVIEVGDLEADGAANAAPSRVPLERLARADYQLFELRPFALQRHDIKTAGKYAYGNFVATPREREAAILRRIVPPA